MVLTGLVAVGLVVVVSAATRDRWEDERASRRLRVASLWLAVVAAVAVAGLAATSASVGVALVAVPLPVLLAGIPQLARGDATRTRWATTASSALLLAFVAVFGLGLGLAFLPSAIAMALAAATTPTQPLHSTTS